MVNLVSVGVTGLPFLSVNESRWRNMEPRFWKLTLLLVGSSYWTRDIVNPTSVLPLTAVIFILACA